MRFYPFLFLVSFFFPLLLAAQQDSVPYTPGFHLHDGIYFSFHQFRRNRPVPKSAILSSIDTTRIDYFKQLTGGKTVSWKDSSGMEQTTNVSTIWGYCENNVLYVQANNQFNRVVVIGSICHFSSVITQYSYTPTVYGLGYEVPEQNLVQFIIDTKTGSILSFTAENLETILQRDPEINKEFKALHKNKQRKMIFIYMRMYNDRHPLYFPG